MDIKTAVLAASMVKDSLSESGKIGRDESHIVNAPLHLDREVDMMAMGVGFHCQSSLTPTKQELLDGKIELVTNGESREQTIVEITFDNDVLFGVATNESMIVIVAYKTGEHTVYSNGTPIAINIPKTGIYTAESGETFADISLRISWGTITPIDSKYLPEGGVGYTEKRTPILDFTYEFTTKSVDVQKHLEVPLTGTEKIFEVGHMNYIYWDGELYTCETTTNEAGVARYIGNIAKQNGTGDTGEPFYIVTKNDPKAFKIFDLTFEENGSVPVIHTIQIFDGPAETIHPIDPKYLPGTREVFKLQDYGIDFYEIYMGGQLATELDCRAFVADVFKAFNAGKVPYVFFHDMFPEYIPITVSENSVALSVLSTIDGMTRFDVLITLERVFMVGTNLTASLT